MNTQFFEIYRVGEAIYGTPLRATTTYQLRLEYDHCFNLPGKTACYFLVTRSDTIRREEAIAFAAANETGRLFHIHIDLSQMTVTRYRDYDEREY